MNASDAAAADQRCISPSGGVSGGCSSRRDGVRRVAGCVTLLTALLAGMAVTPLAVGEAAGTPDPRLVERFRDAPGEFTIDEDGDFRVIYDLGGGRSQLVWARSGTATLGGLEVRQVWSIAYRTRGPLPAELANRLLEQNGTVILGAWIIQPADGEIGVIFAVQVPADADTLAIRSAIHAVATTTDAMENELTGIDEF